MTDHTALIEALERADGPSRELDGQIAKVIMPDKDWLPSHSYGPGVYANPNGSATACPRYTASIDAALTLVPEGCDRADHVWPDAEGGFCTYLWAGEPRRIVGKSRASTPAIALCIAALRASAAK